MPNFSGREMGVTPSKCFSKSPRPLKLGFFIGLKMRIRAFVFGEGMSYNKDIFSMCPHGGWIQYAEQGYWVNEHNKEPEFVIMESTGVLGRNAVEIFEGDIVVFEPTTCTFIESPQSGTPFSKGQIFIVKKLPCGFFLSTTEMLQSEIPSQVGHIDPYTFWNHQKSFRVVGNIYENKELIEASQATITIHDPELPGVVIVDSVNL